MTLTSLSIAVVVIASFFVAVNIIIITTSSKWAMTLCVWGVKADMVLMWVAGKTVISLLHTGHI